MDHQTFMTFIELVALACVIDAAITTRIIVFRLNTIIENQKIVIDNTAKAPIDTKLLA